MVSSMSQMMAHRIGGRYLSLKIIDCIWSEERAMRLTLNSTKPFRN
jgi:hypothetical protein